eukprot:1161669-Pelagomonas_calceolata.AAC.11
MAARGGGQRKRGLSPRFCPLDELTLVWLEGWEDRKRQRAQHKQASKAAREQKEAERNARAAALGQKMPLPSDSTLPAPLVLDWECFDRSNWCLKDVVRVDHLLPYKKDWYGHDHGDGSASIIPAWLAFWLDLSRQPQGA